MTESSYLYYIDAPGDRVYLPKSMSKCKISDLVSLFFSVWRRGNGEILVGRDVVPHVGLRVKASRSITLTSSGLTRFLWAHAPEEVVQYMMRSVIGTSRVRSGCCCMADRRRPLDTISLR